MLIEPSDFVTKLIHLCHPVNLLQPALSALQTKYTQQRHNLAEEQSTIQEASDRLMEELSQKMDEIMELESQIRMLNDQHSQETEVSDDSMFRP